MTEQERIAQLQADYNSSQQTVRSMQTEREKEHEQWKQMLLERNNARHAANVAARHGDELRSQLDRAVSELADARKDTERLDWLDTTKYDQRVKATEKHYTADRPFQLQTLREAIDTARAATDPAKEPAK